LLLKSTIYTEAKIPQAPDSSIKSNLVYMRTDGQTHRDRQGACSHHPSKL
jgi:hypothetical protein